MEENFVISQTKLFVGGLDWSIRGKDLNEEFSKFGEVVFARVNLDRENRNRSKGFGFVVFANPEDAAKAQAEMNGKEVKGRAIRVDFAKENPEKMNKEHANESESEAIAE
jgi:RNA recognition motif-containing protein